MPEQEVVVDLTLHPAENAALTPLELLEDFADATPDWHFLEQDSHHYARAKGTPACVLRHLDLRGLKDVDLAFTAMEAKAPRAVRLTLIDPQGEERQLNLETRNRVVENFLKQFRSYLEYRGDHVRVEVEQEQLNPEKAPVRA